MDKPARDLEAIELRLDAFSEWFMRVVVEGEGYERQTAVEHWRMVAGDMRQLIEQARARAV